MHINKKFEAAKLTKEDVVSSWWFDDNTFSGKIKLNEGLEKAYKELLEVDTDEEDDNENIHFEYLVDEDTYMYYFEFAHTTVDITGDIVSEKLNDIVFKSLLKETNIEAYIEDANREARYIVDTIRNNGGFEKFTTDVNMNIDSFARLISVLANHHNEMVLCVDCNKFVMDCPTLELCDDCADKYNLKDFWEQFKEDKPESDDAYSFNHVEEVRAKYKH